MICNLWIFVFRDGIPYCEKDYQVLFGVKCEACHQFITGKVLEVGVMSSCNCREYKNSHVKVLLIFRAKVLIFRNIFSVLALQSSGKVCYRELIALLSIDLWFLCFSFNGDLLNLLHCLFCARSDIFAEVIYVLESPLATVNLPKLRT